MNTAPRSRLPNAPNQALDEELRATVPQTQEGDIPRGREYVPGPEDNKPLQKDPQREIPSFIPRELAIDPSVAASNMQRNSAPLPPAPEGYPMSEEDAEADELIRQFQAENQPHMKKQAKSETVLPNEPLRHPMLDRLLSSFGIQRLPTKSDNIGGMKWEFRRLSTPDHLLAVRYAGMRSRTSQELKINTQYIQAMLAVVSVNGTSIYEMMGYEMTDDERKQLANDPGNPPHHIVENSAPAVIFTLLDSLVPEVLDKLAVSYDELFEQDREFPSDIDQHRKTHWRFECSVHGCDEVQTREPVIVNRGTGAIKNIYCPIHGTPMRPISSLEDYRNGPLA